MLTPFLILRRNNNHNGEKKKTDISKKVMQLLSIKFLNTIFFFN